MVLGQPEASPHEHRWQLLSVDFDGDRQIRELVCEECGEVSFA
jgi:hypothetical protein